MTDAAIAALCLVLSLSPIVSSVEGGPLLVVATVLAMVGASASLLWRRRWPLVPFAAAIALQVGLLYFGQLDTTGHVIAASYALAVYGSLPMTGAGIGVALLAVGGVSVHLLTSGTLSPKLIDEYVPFLCASAVIATLIGLNARTRNKYLAAIVDHSRRLVVERDQRAQLAAIAERARIAREMHDIVSHSLTVIVALSEGAAATADPEQARVATNAAAKTARGALTEMRAMLGVLRADDNPVPLAPLQPTPPRETVSAAQRAGFPATLVVTGVEQVAPAVAHAIGRIVQEGVTNAMRHAPSATRIVVRLRYAPDKATIEITNDGAVGAVDRSGFGVRGMMERAAHVNGTLTSGPDDQGQWVLHAELPSTVEPSDQERPLTEEKTA